MISYAFFEKTAGCVLFSGACVIVWLAVISIGYSMLKAVGIVG